LLEHALRAVTRSGVGHLMPEHRGEGRVVLRDGQDAGVDDDLSTRQTEGIHLVIADERRPPIGEVPPFAFL